MELYNVLNFFLYFSHEQSSTCFYVLSSQFDDGEKVF